MLNNKYFVLACVFLVISVTPAIGITTETLTYEQCKIYYQLNETCTNNINCTHFYPIEVCGPSFPRINKHIELTTDNPVLILPEYNLSVKISESVFRSVSDEIITNKEKISTLESKVEKLSEKLNNIQKDMNDQKKEIEESINKLREALMQEITRLDSEIKAQNTTISTLQQGLMNLSTKTSGSENIVIAVIVIIVIFAVYILYRKGILQKPQFLGANGEELLSDDIEIPKIPKIEKKKKETKTKRKVKKK